MVRAKLIAAILPFAVAAGHAGLGLSGLVLSAASAKEAPVGEAALDEAPFTQQFESHVTVGADYVGTEIFTQRFRVLTPSAIEAGSERHLTFVDGIESLDTVEAYTMKADGRRLPVPAKNVLTQDAGSDEPGMYLRDEKQRTVIFPDVGVGDTLVVTSKRVTAWGKLLQDFVHGLTFARSAAYTSVKVTVEAPASIGLRVAATGHGVVQTEDENGGLQRHTIAITPEPYAPDEASTVSELDRDPVVLMSTYPSYEEFGAGYGRKALAKARVTPDIAALAGEITRGIAGRREQAAAIDAWMKKNIRYVAVYLSSERVVPNEASTILQNRFGDCKDKATLMMALLAANGIAAEQVLINADASYKLPPLPAYLAFNHVILYLPEFDLYDDPTENRAAFGVLSSETYDKPVVRVSADGARVAHTPAMKPDDHTAYTKTTVNVAADGAVTGQTEESNTGALAVGLRAEGGYVQRLGGAAAARKFLQDDRTPGAGQFDLGDFSGTADPVVIKGTFALDERFRVPVPNGRAHIPLGTSLNAEPGTSLLGSRLSGRKSAFVCYAGRQVEDVEATFAPPWPLPMAPAPLAIDNPAFHYRSTASIEGRTVKIHREFVSRVERQVCPPELEATIAPDLEKVRINVSGPFTFRTDSPAGAARANAAAAQSPAVPLLAALPPTAGPGISAAPGPSRPLELARVAAAGERLRVEFLYAIEPDCSSMGTTSVRILEQPQHGRLTVQKGRGFTGFEKDNQRYDCNTRKSDGTYVFYQPKTGYGGKDSFTLDVIFPTGQASRRQYAIDVR
jgi:transglutaminase-like putative cysteine protease